MADTYLNITGESTIGTYFGFSATSTGDKTWIPILDFPEMLGAPNTIEVTDMSDRFQRFVKGVQSSDTKQFTVNYSKEAFDTLSALEGSQYCFLYFGDTAQGTPDGHLGKFMWQGEIAVGMNGGSVDARKEMVVYAIPNSPITFA